MKIDRFRCDLLGLSTEDKPEWATSGTTYYEVDTQKLYIMYEGTWYLQGENEEADSLIVVGENINFKNLVLPRNMSIVLEKNILDYLTAEDKAEIESQVETDGYAYYPFYEYVAIPHVEEGEDTPENNMSIIGLSLNINDMNVYKISMEGTFTRSGDSSSNEFYIKFSSLDGINFFVSDFSVLYYNDGAEYSVIPEKMEFPVTLNFSEMVSESEDAKGWNDVISEFLFTDEIVEDDEAESEGDT